jgi:predicted short-subunit dehydrogenase-like oxidoreductase (DUF2520 family)
MIGAGNVATNLAVALFKKGFTISQIISKHKKSASLLAKKVNASFTDSIDIIDKAADIYFLCVNDDSIETVFNLVTLKEKTIIHTSGSVDIKAIANIENNYGVFYPLQTFTKDKTVSFKNIPIFIEGDKRNTAKQLNALASQISKNVQHANSETRLHIHLAAVFANNYTNHLLVIAQKILKEKNCSLSILYPLIDETIQKAMKYNPAKIQTGPAKRGDKTTMNKHLKLLEKHSDFKKIYQVLSSSIKDNSNEKL